MYDAQVLADSISPEGVRLTTLATTWPHAVHKDFMTHRAFNRNFESFRARPTEKLLPVLMEEGGAFMPEVFAQRIKGMGQGDEIKDQSVAKTLWRGHVDHCIFIATEMLKLDIAKQQVNFVLQDLCPIVGIVTATEWENFRGLRTTNDPNAQPRPEVKKVAVMMVDAIDASSPVAVEHGVWHLPLVEFSETWPNGAGDDPARQADWEYWAMVSAGRCARASYDKHLEQEDHEKSYGRAVKLQANGHLSPFEHAARPFSGNEELVRERMRDEVRDGLATGAIDERQAMLMIAQTRFLGPLRGWHQFRKDIPNESNFLVHQAAQYAVESVS